MKKILFALFTMSLFGISCQQDDVPTPPSSPDKYMSLAASSTWNYEIIDNRASSTKTFTLTSTSNDSTVNGKSYHIYTNSGASGNEYYNITGTDYYNFRKLPSIFGTGSVEYLYLKDNAAKGTNWSQSFPVTVNGTSLNLTITNTITEKGLTKVVKGITYKDVFHVTTTLTVAVGSIPLPGSALTTDIQSFYAAKFGAIQTNTKIDLDFAGTVYHSDEQMNLVTATIK